MRIHLGVSASNHNLRKAEREAARMAARTAREHSARKLYLKALLENGPRVLVAEKAS